MHDNYIYSTLYRYMRKYHAKLCLALLVILLSLFSLYAGAKYQSHVQALSCRMVSGRIRSYPPHEHDQSARSRSLPRSARQA
jgi:hypothetical protein